MQQYVLSCLRRRAGQRAGSGERVMAGSSRVQGRSASSDSATYVKAALEVAVQLDRAGRGRGCSRSSRGSAPAAGARRRPRADLPQRRAAEQPLPAPGPLLEVRRGEAPAPAAASAPCSSELPPEMRLRYADVDKVCRRHPPQLQPPLLHLADLRPSRWTTARGPARSLTCACSTPRSPTASTSASRTRKLFSTISTNCSSDLPSEAGQGPGDQPQAHRDPDASAWRSSTRSRGELPGDRRPVRRHRGRAAADPRPVRHHARPAAGQRAARQPRAGRRADRADRARGGGDLRSDRRPRRRSRRYRPPNRRAPIRSATASGTELHGNPSRTRTSTRCPVWARRAFREVLLAHHRHVRPARQRARPGALEARGPRPSSSRCRDSSATRCSASATWYCPTTAAAASASPTRTCRPISAAPSPATTASTAPTTRRDCRAIPTAC